MNTPLFSVIIPTYNSQDYVMQAVYSVENQTCKNYECIIVDDGSTDNTKNILKELKETYENLQVYENAENSGPGIARNTGVNHAKGEYILFLDSDDELAGDLLENLSKKIESEKGFDICDFNFCKGNHADVGSQGIRKDMEYLKKPPRIYMQEFLKLHMDAQVIQTCYRRDFLRENNIAFSAGYHEDVAFFFKAYCLAKKRALLEYVGYIKRDRSDSIVNTCSKKHIVGFFHAWQDVKLLIEKDGKMLGAWKEGFIAIGAIKIRDIKKSCLPLDEKMALYRMVGEYVQSNISKEERYLRFQTKYYMLVNTLLNMLEEEQCVEKIEARIGEMMKKSWSCWDIQHSLFLGGDEIRACCKRFFYDGCQKGDVVLAKLSQGMSGKEVYQTFEKEKKRLYIDINKGEKKECEGCPYLSFENWDNDFGIKKISFEYHSLCNLRCNYCSDTYYGGRVPVYDVVEFVDKLVQEGLLSECESIVWGGGEPTLEKNFVTLLQKIMENNIGASHNVITNATKYVPELSDFLTSGRINLITSIDAGTNETYRKIRGKDLLDTVWNNLNQYAKKNASKIIIKYIVKKENCNPEELNCFVNKIEEYCLEDCNFQISCDFNQESLEYEEKLGVVVLYGLLRKKGVEIIYFDELLRERLKIGEGELEKIDSYLQKLGLSHIRLRRRLENIVIWGSDNQIKSLLDHTIYFADVKPVGLIAGHASYYGKECGGLCYQSPKDFKNQDVCFVIAAVQGTRRIYDEFIREGFSKQQLITELIL